MPISTKLHLLMLFLVLCLILVTQYWGRYSKKAGVLDETSRIMGVGMITLWILYNIYYFHPKNFDWGTSLPLHMCDIVALVSGITLLKSYRIGRSLLYFSALALTTQAIITPIGNQDPLQYRFWLYWILHAGIISCSLFDLLIRGYEPNIKDFFSVVIVDIIYVLLVLPLNIILGWNYGYMGNSKPNTPTIIDLLGPWPERVIKIIGLGVVMQAIMLALWIVHQKITQKSGKTLALL